MSTESGWKRHIGMSQISTTVSPLVCLGYMSLERLFPKIYPPKRKKRNGLWYRPYYGGGATNCKSPVNTKCGMPILIQISHEIVELVKEADPYIYIPRASSKPQRNWRAKVSAPGSPELGNPRVWIIGDAMHAMLPTRYGIIAMYC